VSVDPTPHRAETAMPFVPCDDEDGVDAPCPACTECTLRPDTLETFFHSLRELVDGLHVRRSAYAIINCANRYRYAQVLADRDGALLVEVSSTEATRDRGGSAALIPAEELALMRLRFAPPDDWSPNWHRVFAEPWPWPAPVVAELLVHALVWVLGAQPGELRVTTDHAEPTFSVARGNGRVRA
jgi:hypothetical protein